MRLLHVYSGNLWGGVETMLLTIARASREPADDVHEFALCFTARLADELMSAGAVVHELGGVRLRAPWRVLRARRRLADVARSGAYDAVIFHSAWIYGLFGNTTMPSETRVAFWAHDILTGTHWTERLARRAGRPPFVLSNSDYTGTTVGRVWPGATAITVHCPVRGGALSQRDARARVRSEMGCDGESVVLLQVGRLEPWKGHLDLIAALATLRDIRGWSYWIVGGAQRNHEERYLETIRERATRAGIGDRVAFLGQHGDVSPLMAAADIFCQPNSLPEPFGIAMVEALFAGLPVVATTPGGAGEVVNATCGVLVPAGDVSAMRTALERLILDREGRMALGAAGPRRARDLADPATQMRRLHHVLRGEVA